MSGGLGCFYGVGVGPGDPELLTLKAYRVMTTAPVICVPKRGYSADGYAYSIVRDLFDPVRQEMLELVFPMRRDRSQLLPYWEQNLSEIMERINAGKDCAFITEGDPFLYSTFIFMHDMMRERHPEVHVDVIPGITSITAASCRTIPLANGDERIAIIPATYDEMEHLRQVLRDFDSVVLMKVNSVFDQVLDLLEEEGLADNAVFVKKVGAPEEEVVYDVRSLRGKKIEYLSIMLVHK